jgi:DNA mismatch repair protein MutH
LQLCILPARPKGAIKKAFRHLMPENDPRIQRGLFYLKKNFSCRIKELFVLERL